MLNDQYSEILFQELSAKAQDKAMMELPLLVGAKFSKDGNQYCWLLGDDLHDGVVGFGNTAYEATTDFYKSFFNEKA